MAKETFWFKHDYEPTSDPKMQAMLGEFGAIGYGCYWRIVEMLYSDELHKLPLEPYIYSAIANQMQASAKQNEASFTKVEVLPEQVEFFINRCIKHNKLFASDGNLFWSERIMRDLDIRKEISLKRSQSGSRGGKNKGNAKQDQPSGKQLQANAKQNQAEKRREEKSREEEDSKSNKLTTPQKENYCCNSAQELKTAAAAAMRVFDPSLPDTDVEVLARELSTKYVGKEIQDFQALCNSFVKNKRTKFVQPKSAGEPIEVEGQVHKPTKRGKDWVYPTIVGEEFSDDYSMVRLMDGSWMRLEASQRNAAKKGNLKPQSLFRDNKALVAV